MPKFGGEAVNLAPRESAAAEGLRQLELACLPTSLEWKVWWNEWSRNVEMTHPWQRALIDCVTRLQKNQITLARQIRSEKAGKRMIQYNSEGYVWGEETRAPDEITREALVWFLATIRPVFYNAKDRLQPGIPEWAGILARAVQGCFIQQARFGLELSAVKKKGYLTLNASATKRLPEGEALERAVHDKGIEGVAGIFSTTDEETL